VIWTLSHTAHWTNNAIISTLLHTHTQHFNDLLPCKLRWATCPDRVHVPPDTSCFCVALRSLVRFSKKSNSHNLLVFFYYNPCDWLATLVDRARVVMSTSKPTVEARHSMFICQQNHCVYHKIFNIFAFKGCNQFLLICSFFHLSIRCNITGQCGVAIDNFYVLFLAWRNVVTR